MNGDEESYEELPLYYKGLIMGLLLGIIENLFVSYLMKVLDFLGTPFWAWALAAGASFIWILYLV